MRLGAWELLSSWRASAWALVAQRRRAEAALMLGGAQMRLGPWEVLSRWRWTQRAAAQGDLSEAAQVTSRAARGTAMHHWAAHGEFSENKKNTAVGQPPT